MRCIALIWNFRTEHTQGAEKNKKEAGMGTIIIDNRL